MSRWAKMASDFDTNPKAVAAGRAGREVFLFALRRNAEQQRNGRLPRHYFTSRYLNRLLEIPEAEAEEGVYCAIEAGLLAEDGDEILLVGWNDEWRGPLTSGERSKQHRARKRSEASRRDGAGRDETDGTDGTHKRRGEERRDPPRAALAGERSSEGREELLSTGAKPSGAQKKAGVGKRKTKGNGKAKLPFQIRDLIAAFKRGAGDAFVDDFDVNLAKPLNDLIRRLEAKGKGLADVEAAGRHVASWGGDIPPIGVLWLTKTGNLFDAIAKARRERGDPEADESLGTFGLVP